MDLTCYLVFFCSHLMFAAARTSFPSRVYKQGEAGCSYQGYIPGGRVKSTTINSPMASVGNEATAQILGHVESATTLSAEVLSIAQAASKVFSSAPSLGSIIGIFGGIVGTISNKMTPTATDILRAANEGIEKLTDDMNEKLQYVREYVDDSIIESEKNAIKSFTHNFNLLVYCVKSPTKELASECQRDAIKSILSSRHEFAVFSSALLEGDHHLTTKQLKTLEAFLIPFRNYANLVILGLSALIERYRNDNSEVGRGWYKTFSKDLNDNAEFFLKYSKAAVRAIFDGHDAIESCKSSFELRYFDISQSTYTNGKARCLIDPFTNQRCEITGFIRTDGTQPPQWPLWIIQGHPTNPREDMIDLLTGKLYNDIYNDKRNSVAEAYDSVEKLVMKAYWRKEIVGSLPNWEKAIKIASPGLNVKGDVLSYDYSPRHKLRKDFVQRYPNIS